MCAWGVPPEQHKDHVFIHDTYTKKMKTLEEEPEVTAAVKCKESQVLNWQLMSIERALFDAGDIKEHDPLMPLTYLRSGASAACVGNDLPARAAPRLPRERPLRGWRSGGVRGRRRVRRC